jgi:hypothetical protein
VPHAILQVVLRLSTFFSFFFLIGKQESFKLLYDINKLT